MKFGRIMSILSIFLMSLILFSQNICADELKHEGLKGVIHIHLDYPGDDGQNTLEEVIQAYKSKGYDFIVITPHNPELFNSIDKGFTRDNFTVIYGWESTNNFHILHFGNITVLAHPYPTIMRFKALKLPEKLYSNRTETSFVEVLNCGSGLTDYPLLPNSIVGEDMHNLKDGYGCCWIDLDCENNVDSILAAFDKCAKEGKINWGCHSNIPNSKWSIDQVLK